MLIITGTSGFIGSNIAAHLNASDREDLVLVDQHPATADLRALEFVHKDALNEWLCENERNVDAILHMGACSDTTQTDRDYMMRTNLEYTRELWRFCARNGKRFVYASSAATYGDGSAGYDDACDPRTLKPLNLYGESKQLFDLWALEEKSAPPGWAGLKFFNVYGPREEHKQRMASVAFHAFNQIKQSGKVRLFKSDREGIPDGGQKRDFVYVKDVVAATLFMLKAPPQKIGGLFNVGSGKARTFADLARAVFAALHREPNIEYIPMPDDLKGKYQYFTEATIEKLRVAGFTQPMHSLEDGVRDYVQGYLNLHP